MNNTFDEGVNAFISYSHDDAKVVKCLREHFTSAIGQERIRFWYDRDIEVGTEWSPEIEQHLVDSELVVFCVSPSFLRSKACMEEFRRSVKLKEEKNTQIVPIIIEDCEWKESKEISRFQSLPEYGRPLSSFDDQANILFQLETALNNKIDLIQRRRTLTLQADHQKWLNAMDPLLSVCGVDNFSLQLDDVYIDPELEDLTSNDAQQNIILASDIVTKLTNGDHVIIAGEDQSGKTAICKKVFLELFARHYFPVFMTAENKYQENPHKVIETLISRQYSDPSCISYDRVILIMDDFSKGKHIERFLSGIPTVKGILVVFDDIYNFNMRNASAFSEYHRYMILKLRARKRKDLIVKWLSFRDGSGHEPFDNYRSRDRLTRNVEAVLGKTFGQGVVPSYPFFILSIIITSEISLKPLDQSITSQGYCYQALLYAVLRKVGVHNLHIDFYIKFLEELSYMLYKNNATMNCSEDELLEFVKNYKEQYNLSIPVDEVLKKIDAAKVFGRNNLGDYDFKYKYLKYYFIGKRLSEHYQECKGDIDRVLTNLGYSSNAYIAVFIAMHGTGEEYLGDLMKASDSLLKFNAPCFLTRNDLREFEQQSESIVDAVIPISNVDPEIVRDKLLVKQEEEEKREASMMDEGDSYGISAEDDNIREFRTSFRLCQVMGMILKSRPGSVKKSLQIEFLSKMFELYGRIIRDFFDTFKDEGVKREIIRFLGKSLKDSGRDSARMSQEKRRHEATTLFWNINFMTTFGIVLSCAQAIGSIELFPVIKETCSSSKDRPFVLIMPCLVDVLFRKNVKGKVIGTLIQEIPAVVRRMIKFVMARYCATHKLEYAERQRIESIFELKPTLKLYLKSDSDSDVPLDEKSSR